MVFGVLEDQKVTNREMILAASASIFIGSNANLNQYPE
jgi:hypothetical protein